MNLLEGLNEAQKEAVLHKNGPLLVLAGAGAGKTRAIAHRVAHLVEQGTEPERILAITFTNKAAGEMKERINKLLTTDYSILTTPFVSTFHSLGVFILRNHGRGLGINKNFSIFDKENALEVIKESIRELGIDPKQFQPDKMLNMISRYKGDLISCEDFEEIAGRDFFPRKLSNIWDAYEKKLKAHQALDFDDLILKTVLLFKKDKEARSHYQNLWQYILIDEYQDTNKSQYELSKILAEKHRNICVIGDIDQAIYGWRGADFRNIINFERDFPEVKTIVFEENYRSTKNILEAAARVIEKNKMRKEKKLSATREEGAVISLFEAMNEKEEAEFVVHKIKELIKTKVKPSEVAVLYRANFQSRIFEEECLKRGIPYNVLGTRFYERKEVKDIFSFIRAALNRDNLLDFKRVINVPPRGIGKVSILNYFAQKKLPIEMEKKIGDFLAVLDQIKEKIENSRPSEVVKFIMKKTDYQDFLENGSDDDKERLENLKELVSIASRYDSLETPLGMEKMITDAALMSDQDNLDFGDKNKKEGARLMTVHAAKGLEFENVFIVGMEQGLFPHSGFGANNAEKEEEERRLFYVALTRAKEKLFLSFSIVRTIFGGRQMNLPSRFLSDIPEHLMKLEKNENQLIEEEIIEIL
ncbi:MAG: UvrD-helicase domain-containing protein [Candidatus Paceibacterota bacterium]